MQISSAISQGRGSGMRPAHTVALAWASLSLGACQAVLSSPDDDPLAKGGDAAANGGAGGGGTGQLGDAGSTPVVSGSPVEAPAPETGAVVISEIMYHPVLENAAEDNHEFVELYNRSPAAVSLAGWKLAGNISFTFPPGTSIGPGQYLVVA